MNPTAKKIVLGIVALIVLGIAWNTWYSLTAPTASERNLEEYREKIGE